MKKRLFLLVILGLSFVACGMQLPLQEITQEAYSIKIPKEWSYKVLGKDSLNFYGQGDYCGSFYKELYVKEGPVPLGHFISNHTEIIEEANLDGFIGYTTQFKTRLTPPAASGKNWSQNWTYLFIEQEPYVYILICNEDFITEKELLETGKSLRIRP